MPCVLINATWHSVTKPGLIPQLTQLHLLQRGVCIIPGPFSGVFAAGHVAGDLCLGGAQVHQQGGDLGLELQGGRVLEHTQQVQLEVLTHAAHLGLGQRWGQVGCEDRVGSLVLGTDHCGACQAQFSALAAIPWEIPRLTEGLVGFPLSSGD